MTCIVSVGYVPSISQGKFFFFRGDGPLHRMQTVQDTRRQRLGILKAEFNTWAALNTKIGWESTNTRLSQIHSGTIRSDRGTPYTMGDETAREIEAALKLESGWMDTPPTRAESDGSADTLAMATELLAAMEPEAQYQALRILGALAQPTPANGTTGPSGQR